jgi:hypothetical protein
MYHFFDLNFISFFIILDYLCSTFGTASRLLL